MADALSQAEPQLADLDFQGETANILRYIPATEQRVEEIKRHQEQDNVCKQLSQFCPTQWPEKQDLSEEVPTTRKGLMPVVPDRERVKEKDKQKKFRQERNFNDRHGGTLPHLDPGNCVWVPDRGSEAEVVGQTNPHTYRVNTPEGTYRRNRRALCPLPVKQTEDD